MATLERAIVIATEAHAGQIDKAGAPYVLHPLRVMLAQTTDVARIAAVLHDVCEDSPDWSFARLRAEGFDEHVLSAVDAVTKRDDEHDDYEAFVRRAASHPVGRLVKLADMKDNADLSRIATPTDKDRARVAKYLRAIALIESGAL